MPTPLFSHDWALGYQVQINARHAYREAAATWEGDVVLLMNEGKGTGERMVYLDLWHGECRSARAGTTTDLESARYVLAATATTWRQVLGGQVAPLIAIMTGKLRFARGDLAALLPYMTAAGELLRASRAVETVFPE